ncbi:MAG TPA: xanthine dehydrogenase family protein subunit M [Magnetospirillaceae bacterium]|jgi:xanthine dehydrogenase YagS FAD-binding subunit
MRPFLYQRPADRAAAEHAILAENASILGGGTTLLDLMKLDAMRPDVVVDINDLAPGAAGIDASAGGLHLSAFVTMAETAAHPDILRDYPVIAQSLQLAASPQIRNMARLGGNVLQRTRCSYFRDGWTACNKRSPGSGCAALDGVNRKHAVLGTSDSCIATYPGDFAQALVALDALIEITSERGPRNIRFAELHRLPDDTPHLETTLAPGEMITGFFVPAGAWTRRSKYLKIRDRESYEFALASAAVALDLDGTVVRQARIALGGVATKPWRSAEAEAVLVGKPVSEANAHAAAEAAFAGAKARSGNGYKIELGRQTLVRAVIETAALQV